MSRTMRARIRSRGSGSARGRTRADLAVTAILVAALSAVACGRHDEPEPAADDGAKGAASPPSADASASGAARAPAEAPGGAVRIDPNPSAPSPASTGTAPGGAAPAAAEPAPGTISLRFIVRKHETKEELPAGSFEVRLVPLDPIREGRAADAGAAGTGTGSGVATEAPRPGPGVPIGPAAASGRAPGGTYQGAPEQVLVTQLDGSKRTFLAGVRPGTYAMRITAKGRRMLLEALTVKAEDRLVERTLEADEHRDPPAGAPR